VTLLRAAFVLPDFDGGGSQRVALNLLRGLPRDRFAPEVVVLSAAGPLAGSLAADVPVLELGPPKLRQAAPRLAATLRERRPDVIFSTFGHINVVLLAMRPLLGFRPRLVIREGNTPSESLPRLRFGRALGCGYRAFYRLADCVICQSRRIARELHERFGVPEARLVRLANPVEVETIRARAEPVRREPGAGARFVSAGRLTHQKGFDRLLEMFSALPRTARLLILGEGEDGEALRSRAERLRVADRVGFPGFAENPWPLFAGADAFLLPSRWEGMPNAALEALACGTPVIASAGAGGFDEVAEEATGGAAAVAAPGPDFIAAMLRAPERPAARLRPSLLPERFSSSRVLDEFSRCLAP
jgi:glycosyltransferase involved in cell wall biosynthesis